MEQRGVLLRGIATVLNAGGCALLNIYDAAVSIKTVVLPGEKGTLSAQMREYERKLELIYGEIGKEVAFREESAGLSAAAEAGIIRAAEYQAEIEKIRQRLQEIAAEEKAAAAAKKETTPERDAARAKTAPEAATEETKEVAAEVPAPEIVPDAAESVEPAAAAESTYNAPEKSAAIVVEAAETPAPEIVPDAAESVEPAAAPESTDDKPEKSSDIVVTAAETPEQELQKEMVETEPFAVETLPEAETEEAATAELETLLKSDLLQICSEKGVEADKKMTKAEIIALLSGR